MAKKKVAIDDVKKATVKPNAKAVAPEAKSKSLEKPVDKKKPSAKKSVEENVSEPQSTVASKKVASKSAQEASKEVGKTSDSSQNSAKKSSSARAPSKLKTAEVQKKEVEVVPEKPKKTSSTRAPSKLKTAEAEPEKEEAVSEKSNKKSASTRAPSKLKAVETEPEKEVIKEEVEVTPPEPEKVKNKSSEPKPAPKPKVDASMIKGGMKITPEKVEQLKLVLLDKLKEVRGDVPSLMAEGLGNSNENSNSPLHFAELGTDTFNQNFALGRLEREETLLGWIYEALEKIENGKFGTCNECGDYLRVARLEFAPWVPNCVECQEKLESNYSQD